MVTLKIFRSPPTKSPSKASNGEVQQDHRDNQHRRNMMHHHHRLQMIVIPMFILILVVMVSMMALSNICTVSQITTSQEDQLSQPTTSSSRHPKTTRMMTMTANTGLPSLDELTRPSSDSSSTTCGDGLYFRENMIGKNKNINNSNSETSLLERQLPTSRRRIPKIVHQTSKSRCISMSMYSVTQEWYFNSEWSYYFHDDDAVMRLLTMSSSSLKDGDTTTNATTTPNEQEAIQESDISLLFPHLRFVAENCVLSGTVKADLWRYVVLWYYGGIYADLDSAPNLFNDSTITDYDDGFFVVEQYHMLSQYFMAVSPRHPLMYYAIQRTLLNLLQLSDTGKLNAALVTGPHALHAGYVDFRADAGVVVDFAGRGMKPVWNGTFTGTNGRSIRVVGVGENENEYVWRSKVKGRAKNIAYEQMGMEHFSARIKDKNKMTHMGCLTSILQK